MNSKKAVNDIIKSVGSSNLKGPKIIKFKVIFAFFSISFLLFGSTIVMSSYAQPQPQQKVPLQGKQLVPQLQRQQQVQSANATQSLSPQLQQQPSPQLQQQKQLQQQQLLPQLQKRAPSANMTQSLPPSVESFAEEEEAPCDGVYFAFGRCM